jgi:tungstate transport system substrate-binding protein
MSTSDSPEASAADSPDESAQSDDSKPALTIGQLAKKFKVSLRTLRFYESRGFITPERSNNRRRLYGQKDADRLTTILKAKKLGFTLSEIRRMIGDEGSTQTLQLTQEKCLKQIEHLERELAEIKEGLAELRSIYASIAAQSEGRSITVRSTTSILDSGLFDFILPIFKTATGLNVHVIAVGTGHALAIEGGDADALLVHDRIGEEKFVAEGFGVDRREVMYNDFVIVGPSTDPAGIRGLRDAKGALTKIAAAKAAFASRGDDSGTHRMSLRLWKSAGIEPHNDWYHRLGQGMMATLNIAAAMNAYTLTDRATWENFKNRQNLEILTEGDPALVNPYASILVNPEKRPQVKINDAWIWHEWLTTTPGLDAITSYRVDGKELYFPPGKRTEH